MDLKDYFVRDIAKKCDVCSHIVMVDQYGNGCCEHCGWVQNKDEEEFEKRTKISYPNLVPLSRARAQYKKGVPFKPTFEDFVNGLYFYSEMVFSYKGNVYEVYFKPYVSEEIIVMCSLGFKQEFLSREDFVNNSSIDGVLLKDLWTDVTNAQFMSCG